MYREVSRIGDGQLGVVDLSGLEITGLVVALVFLGALIWMTPELIRYVKMSRM